MKQELRTLSVAIRAAKDDAFELNGTAVSYGVLSQDLGGFRERIMPGCFTRALASNPDVKMLFNHDANHILGRTANKTLLLFDTPQGLNFRCILDPNQQAHRDLHSSIKRGDINQMSFAFAADEDDFDEATDERGARFIRRSVRAARIYDCSAVVSPAYNAPGATSVSARSTARVVAPTLRRPNPNEKSYEQRFLEKYGVEYVGPQRIAMRMATLALQVKAHAPVLEELRRADEQFERDRANLNAELFPWESRQ